MKRKDYLFIATILLSLTLLLLIWTDWWPQLRGPAPQTSEWYWPYQIRPYAHFLLPILTTLIMFIIASYWLTVAQTHKWRVRISLLALILGCITLQIGLVAADSGNIQAELLNRTLSNLSSGFFAPAAEIEKIDTVLRTYPQQMPQFPSDHARTHPPGMVLSNWLTIQLIQRWDAFANWVAPPVWANRCTDLWLLDRPPAVAASLAIWSILPIFIGALAILPTYIFCKRTMHSWASIKLATVFMATLPSLLLFAPKSVQLYPLFTLLILLTFHLGLENRAWGYFLLSGLLFSIATFFSIGNTALALLLIPYALLMLWKCFPTPKMWLSLTLWGAIFAIGALAVWLLYWLLWGVPPWEIVQTGLEQHYELVTLYRRYDWWLGWNLLDLLLFVGLPVLVGFIGYTTLAMRIFLRKRPSPSTPTHILALCLALLILVLTISGSARGEVGRIWLFFMPLIAIVAGAFWAEHLHSTDAQTSKNIPLRSLTLVGIQLLITLSLALAWQPVRAVIVVAQEPPLSAQIIPANPLDVTFSPANSNPTEISLLGYTLLPNTAVLDLTLFWQTNQPAIRPYTVFTQLLDSQNQLIAQKDNWPVNGTWPPTCWQSEQPISDNYQLSLPDNLPVGEYTLIIGLYDARNGTRLQTNNNNDAQSLTTLFWNGNRWEK